ncbi:hypothetical protein ACF0H5_019220 [Mactra antiquata]
MKYFALVFACLLVTSYAQSQSSSQAAQAAVAQAAAAAGGAAGASLASAGRSSLFGGNPLMNLAAMSGQLGDTFQTASMCSMMGLPPFLCMGMGM